MEWSGQTLFQMSCCPNRKPSSSCMVSLVLLWPGLLQFGALFHLLKAEFIQNHRCLCLPVQKKKEQASHQFSSVKMDGGNINTAEPRIDNCWGVKLMRKF